MGLVVDKVTDTRAVLSMSSFVSLLESSSYQCSILPFHVPEVWTELRLNTLITSHNIYQFIPLKCIKMSILPPLVSYVHHEEIFCNHTAPEALTQ